MQPGQPCMYNLACDESYMGMDSLSSLEPDWRPDRGLAIPFTVRAFENESTIDPVHVVVHYKVIKLLYLLALEVL